VNSADDIPQVQGVSDTPGTPQLDLDAHLLKLFEAVSNEGRWGSDDELGTLNYITADVVREACSLVTEGRVVSVGRDLSTERTEVNFWPVQHLMIADHAGLTAAYDYVGINPHGFSITHLDAVAHSQWHGRVYNGRSLVEIQTRTGLSFGSIYAQRGGIVSRGILLDIARVRGVSYLRPDEGISASDLRMAEEASGVHVRSGDVVLVRMGLAAWEREHGPQDVDTRAGLLPDCLEWLHERQVAVYGGDCIEQIPSGSSQFPLPLHHIGMPSMGLVLLDWPDVEPLAAACNELSRWEFLFSVAPIRLKGATGAAVNPLCIF